MLLRVDCEAIRRAEERACHSIVRFEVQLNVVVVDMWEKYWTMALRSSSLMFFVVVNRMHIEFMPWLLSASRWSDR